MQIYEETQQSIIELSSRLEEIAKQVEPISTIEIHAGDIAEQLKRIADALEKLSSIVGDDDSSSPYANIIATCGVINT